MTKNIFIINRYLLEMTEILKQLKIKTAALNRLKKEYISYETEIKTQRGKISEMSAEDPWKLQKQTEFLLESQSVLYNVKQKLIETFEDLTMFLKEKEAAPGVETSAEKTSAQETLDEI